MKQCPAGQLLAVLCKALKKVSLNAILQVVHMPASYSGVSRLKLDPQDHLPQHVSNFAMSLQDEAWIVSQIRPQTFPFK
jgi:hypothetical protein